MKKKQSEKTQEHETDKKNIVEVSSPAISILKNSQYIKKKYNALSTEKYSFSLIKCTRYITTTTTIISIQYTQTDK
jgi:hypothetical protein